MSTPTLADYRGLLQSFRKFFSDTCVGMQNDTIIPDRELLFNIEDSLAFSTAIFSNGQSIRAYAELKEAEKNLYPAVEKLRNTTPPSDPYNRSPYSA